MDNVSLLQITQRIPELKFNYMGSYPTDKMLQLTKYSFAIINSAPGNERGEHWIMIARLDKSYYFADSLGIKRSTNPFFDKKIIDEWFLESYKKLIICVVFTQFVQQKNLKNVHELHDLNFISDFM